LPAPKKTALRGCLFWCRQLKTRTHQKADARRGSVRKAKRASSDALFNHKTEHHSAEKAGADFCCARILRHTIHRIRHPDFHPSRKSPFPGPHGTVHSVQRYRSCRPLQE